MNAEKTKVCRVPEETFDFLGYTFGPCYRKKTGEMYTGKYPSKKRVARFCQTLSELTEPDSYWMAVEDMVAKINSRLRGWGNYFSLGTVSKAYQDVNNHSRHRLRQWLKGKQRGQNRRTVRYSGIYLHERLGLFELTPALSRNFSWANS